MFDSFSWLLLRNRNNKYLVLISLNVNKALKRWGKMSIEFIFTDYWRFLLVSQYTTYPNFNVLYIFRVNTVTDVLLIYAILFFFFLFLLLISGVLILGPFVNIISFTRKFSCIAWTKYCRFCSCFGG